MPSPTARAVRLDGLRATGPDALGALLERLPDPPWDASVDPSDPLASHLERNGFAPYARTVTVVRPAEGMPRPPVVHGIDVEPYRNEWAEAFAEAEAAAMTGLGTYSAMGTPTGYEQGAGHGAFLVARERDRVVGFAHAQVPEGWITWLGVVPDHRRQGIGRALVAGLARALLGARGTHLACEVEDTEEARAFFRALGFREKGRRVLLMRS